MSDEINIFLVEDDDVDVQVMKRALKKVGHTGSFVRARDGVEALDLLRSNPSDTTSAKPQIILLDINMPRMNGHEFLEAVRKDPDLEKSYVFVFTTSDNDRDVERASANRANGYIVKPSTATELKNVLQALSRFLEVCRFPTRASVLTPFPFNAC